MLDPAHTGFSEMTVRTEELARSPIPARRIFAVENEITYLAFPDVPDSAVIFGSGYAAAALAPLSWLGDRELVYWGDLDTHGFAILNVLRAHFPAAVSMLMDRRTLFDHESQWVTEPSQSVGVLDHLTDAEQRLYADLVDHTFGSAVRLEQERIRFSALERALAEIPTPSSGLLAECDAHLRRQVGVTGLYRPGTSRRSTSGSRVSAFPGAFSRRLVELERLSVRGDNC